MHAADSSLGTKSRLVPRFPSILLGVSTSGLVDPSTRDAVEQLQLTAIGLSADIYLSAAYKKSDFDDGTDAIAVLDLRGHAPVAARPSYRCRTLSVLE